MLQWYLGKLKSHPKATNLASALVVMTMGDVMAQELERLNLDDAYAGGNPELEGVPEQQRLHFLHYGNFHQDDLDYGPPSVMRYDGEKSTSNWDLAVELAYHALRNEFNHWDGFRTATMGVWSVGVYAPAWMYLLHLYDKFLPQKTAAVIVFQVLGNIVYSMPINALFFVYGTFVHHTTEWFAVREERLQDFVLRNPLFFLRFDREEPFDWEMFHSKTRLKLHSELYSTVVASAKVWIPINAVNFTVVPPHLRPMGLIFCSVFWNCYLSIAQHRDVALPEGV